MPRDSNGNYTLPPIYEAVTGTTVLAEQHNVPLQDIAQALTNSLPRNGSAPMGANLAMAGFRITNLGEAINPNDAVRLAQIGGLSDLIAGKVAKAGDTMTGQLVLPAGTTDAAPLRVPEGVAPAEPADGDVWVTDSGIFVRIDDVTRALLAANVGALLSAGYTATNVDDGTKSTGTYTPTPVGGNYRRIVNGGAFTFAAPTADNDFDMVVKVTNNDSAGTVTFTGFDLVSGDDLTDTDGDEFFIDIRKLDGSIRANIQALQE